MPGTRHVLEPRWAATCPSVQSVEILCATFTNTVGALLQGEHGTGRNVAPYVEMEWGGKAYDLMWRLKSLFDPDDVLNPGVVLNKVCSCV